MDLRGQIEPLPLADNEPAGVIGRWIAHAQTRQGRASERGGTEENAGQRRPE